MSGPGDTTGSNLRAGAQPRLYRPCARERLAAFLIRSGLPTPTTISQIRSSASAVDPALPITDVATLDARVERLIAEELLLAKLATTIATLAVLLGVSSVYAVIAFFVSERTREFGIRLVIGAPQRTIVTRVLRSILWTCGVGLLIDYGMAVAGRLLIEGFYGMSPLDPLSLTTAGLVLLAVALLAAWLPAWRARGSIPTPAGTPLSCVGA